MPLIHEHNALLEDKEWQQKTSDGHNLQRIWENNH